MMSVLTFMTMMMILLMILIDDTDDDTDEDANDDTDDGGRGNLSRHEEAYWYTRILQHSYCPDINDHPTGHIDKVSRYSDRSR